jgi:hypothetical protein
MTKEISYTEGIEEWRGETAASRWRLTSALGKRLQKGVEALVVDYLYRQRRELEHGSGPHESESYADVEPDHRSHGACWFPLL